MPDPIPFYDIKAENLEFATEFRQAFERILASGRFVLGLELERFEKELGEYLGVGQVVGVKSGTDALYFAMQALGIGKGDEVLTSPFTFPATITGILRTGATPVLADIDPDTLCLCPERCQAAITGRTKAILLVHLFGNCADLNRFISLCQKENLLLIEDSAQAIGSVYNGRKLGSFGVVSGFSFYPTKNLGALGNGGAIVSNFHSPHPAFPISNSDRLDEFQAAFLRIKLRHLDEWLTRRRQLAEKYLLSLSPFVKIVRGAPGAQPNFHQFAIGTSERERLRQFLAKEGIETKVYYPVPIHRQPEFAGLFENYHLPDTERASREILCLPIRHNLTDAEQELIINKIQELCKIK